MAIGKHLTDLNPSGTCFGQSTADKIGFYGLATPIVQPSGAAQATSLLSTASSTAVDTATKAFMIAVGDALTALGLWKGGA